MSKSLKNIVVCGAGNASHTFAALLSQRDDVSVSVFASFQDEAERWNKALASNDSQITALLRDGAQRHKMTGKVSKVAADVIPGADVIIIPLPTFAHIPTLNAIKDHISPKGATIVAMPGQGGYFFSALNILGSAKELKEKNITVAGLNQLPFQCRTKEFGKSVEIIGFKNLMKIAAIPSNKVNESAELINDLLKPFINCKPIHYLAVQLYPANAVIHPGIMYGLFHDFKGEPYKEKPLFYQNTDDFTAKILQGLSDDVVATAQAIQDKTGVKLEVSSLDNMMREQYGDELVDPSSMKTIFQTNKGYKGLFAPMVDVTDDNDKVIGYKPNFEYRYMTEDIPRGLVATRGWAQLAGVATPTTDTVLLWAQQMMDKQFLVNGKLCPEAVRGTAAPQAYDIKDFEFLNE